MILAVTKPQLQNRNDMEKYDNVHPEHWLWMKDYVILNGRDEIHRLVNTMKLHHSLIITTERSEHL